MCFCTLVDMVLPEDIKQSILISICPENWQDRKLFPGSHSAAGNYFSPVNTGPAPAFSLGNSFLPMQLWQTHLIPRAHGTASLESSHFESAL